MDKEIRRESESKKFICFVGVGNNVAFPNMAYRIAGAGPNQPGCAGCR